MSSKNNTYYLVLVDVDLPILSTLPPYALSTQSQPVPSPTVLIGALMYAIRRYRDGSLDEEAPIEEIIRKAFEEGILYALFWVPPYATTYSLERVFTMTYQKPGRAKLLTEENVARCLGDLLAIEDTGDVERASKECREFYDYVVSKMWDVAPRGLVTYATTAHVLYITTNRDLAKWAWLITRIGRREDVAFIRNVNIYDLRGLVTSSINGIVTYKTRFYIPTRLTTTVANSQRWILRGVVNGTIREETFEVPVMGIPSPVPITFKPRPDETVLIKLALDGEVEHVPIPREVVGGEC
jgi:CRISPR-associated protein Cas5 subtype I-A